MESSPPGCEAHGLGEDNKALLKEIMLIKLRDARLIKLMYNVLFLFKL